MAILKCKFVKISVNLNFIFMKITNSVLKKARIILPSLIILLLGTNLFSQISDKKTVYIFDIKKEIAPPVMRETQLALEEASEINADLIIIHMNTYGGMLESADSIRTMILHSKIPVWVFIDNNAASAGALISIACDSIYMRSGANIGAATVVNASGEKQPEKYQSYMRAMMRSTAEASGRDPHIAEAMVDPRVAVPGIADSGQVITFTASEAMKNGYCEGIAESIHEVLTTAGIDNYEIVRLRLTWMDKLIGFLINPVVSGLLIMIIIGGIYFELQTPGIGFPLAASVIAAVLYFAPLYVEGLAANWEILVFVIGLVLLGIEIFVTPGFGVAGITGIGLIFIGLTLSMIENFGFDFSRVNLYVLAEAFFIVITATLIGLISSFFITRKLFTTPALGHLALEAVQESSEGFTIADQGMIGLSGKSGKAMTILRPAGKVIIEGTVYDATAETSYIEKNQDVVVVGYINAQLVVRKG